MSPRAALPLALLLASLLAAGLAGCAEDDPDDPVRPVPLAAIVPVTVRVMSSLTGGPVEGATVSFHTRPLFFAGLDPLRSDRAGRVMAGVLNGVRVDLDVFADGYRTEDHTFTLEGQSGPYEFVVYLEPERLPD